MMNSFFVPFVGNDYQKGIRGKRILVVGASFYCNHSECRFFDECTNIHKKSSERFDAICPEYIKANKLLHKEPEYCIEDAPLTYRRFASCLAHFISEETEYYETWNHMAFTNYIQFFLPAKEGKFRNTRKSDLSERDYDAFNETLVYLQPDIVIIWGCVISKRLKEKNKYLISYDELAATEGYLCHLKIPGIDHDVSLINPYHPSSTYWNSSLDVFNKYFNIVLNNKNDKICMLE